MPCIGMAKWPFVLKDSLGAQFESEKVRCSSYKVGGRA